MEPHGQSPGTQERSTRGEHPVPEDQFPDGENPCLHAEVLSVIEAHRVTGRFGTQAWSFWFGIDLSAL
jgi:hypothetical protein